jgi:LAS seventeen-binding protein 5
MIGCRDLPPPLRPTSSSANPDADEDSDPWQRRGSLSDFSDYESSDEETHMQRVAAGQRRDRVSVSDDEDEGKGKGRLVNVVQDEDPFADPFADEVAVPPRTRW